MRFQFLENVPNIKLKKNDLKTLSSNYKLGTNTNYTLHISRTGTCE